MQILLYNERNYFTGHLRLKTAPVKVDISPIGISIPTGSFKLRYDGYFTHVKFTFDGVDWICKIDSRKALGDNLHEYTYSIDYAKDYFNKYGLYNQDITIERTTDSNYWSKWIVDNQYPRGNKITYNTALDTKINAAVMLVINFITPVDNTVTDDCDTYIIPLKNWSAVQKALLTPVKYSSDTSQLKSISPDFVTTAIRGAYIIPFNDFTVDTDYYTLTPQNYIELYSRETDSSGNTVKVEETLISSGASILKLLRTKTSKGFVIPYTITNSLIRNVTDWRDIELYKYSCYAPFYGAFELNPQHFNGIYYHISPSAGMVTISTTADDIAGMLSPQKLPEINYITDTTISAQRIINQQSAVSTGAALAQTALSIGLSAVGASTGNAMLTMGGIMGAMHGIGSNLINISANRTNQLYALSQQGLQYSAQTGTFGMRVDTIAITCISIEQPLTMSEYANRYGYYADYKIGDTAPLNVRCWLNLHGSRLRGEQWYTNNVYNALHGACIIIDS